MEEIGIKKTFNEILNMDFKDKNVLIIGQPASGKTYLTKKLKINNHKIISTDDYMKYGFKESIYKLLKDLKDIKTNTIIEGIQGFRLLRKGVELNSYYPDIVIQLIISDEQMVDVYKKEREGKKIKYLFSLKKTVQKILNDYFDMENKKKSEWFIVKNNYVLSKDNSTKFCPKCRDKNILNELSDCDGIYFCDECDSQYSYEEIEELEK